MNMHYWDLQFGSDIQENYSSIARHVDLGILAEICSRNMVKFGVNFRAYHKFNRSPDTLNVSVSARITILNKNSLDS